MIKKIIKYTDFNGQIRKDTEYFNMTKLEVLKLEGKFGMDIGQKAQEIAKSKDLSKMIGFIEDIILGSYGEKSADGRSFVKDPAKREAFENSNAFAELIDQLLSDPEETKKFAAGIVGVPVDKVPSPKLVK